MWGYVSFVGVDLKISTIMDIWISTHGYAPKTTSLLELTLRSFAHIWQVTALEMDLKNILMLGLNDLSKSDMSIFGHPARPPAQ